MKVALLLAFCLAGAFAQTVTNWDLSELSGSGSESVEADKAPQAVLDRKASNQGLNGKTSTQGKTSTLSLTVPKERTPRVTDVDRLLFGLESIPLSEEEELTNMTVSYEETASLCSMVLGDTWETQVHLPTEDLTYIELLRLSASLNEFTLMKNGNRRTGGNSHARALSEYECVCHGTAHRFPIETGSYGNAISTEFKDASQYFWGTRVLKGRGHRSAGNNGPHNMNPYATRDCYLCRPDMSSEEQFDCRYCCFGKCVIDKTIGPSGTELGDCDQSFNGLVDTNCYNGEGSDGGCIGRYYNYIGACLRPKEQTCHNTIPDSGCTCTELITILNADTDPPENCDYCGKAVGWADEFCRNCTEAIPHIDNEFGCPCNEAFAQILKDVDTNVESGMNSLEAESGNEESYESTYTVQSTQW